MTLRRSKERSNREYKAYLNERPYYVYSTSQGFSRRGFLKLGTATGAAVLTNSQWVHSAGSNVCENRSGELGRRGSGSLLDSLTAMPNVRVVALGDPLPGEGRRDSCRNRRVQRRQGADRRSRRSDLHRIRQLQGSYRRKRCRAYRASVPIPSALQSGRGSGRTHLHRKAQRHRRRRSSCHDASGEDRRGEETCQRLRSLLPLRPAPPPGDRARTRNGEIGEVVAAQSDYLRTPYNLVPRKPEWSEAEYEIRNWEHFTWLNGDEIQQSLLHNLDSVLSALGDKLPETCYATGGRSSVFSPAFGDLFDHASVIYDYADGKRIYGATRTADNCFSSNINVFHGTKGRMVFNATGLPLMARHAGERTMASRPKRPHPFDVSSRNITPSSSPLWTASRSTTDSAWRIRRWSASSA